MPLDKRIRRLARRQQRLQGKLLLAKGRRRGARRLTRLQKKTTRTGAKLQIAQARKTLKTLR